MHRGKWKLRCHLGTECRILRRKYAPRSPAWTEIRASSSPGDELMTLSTSEVAVCCSSDLAQFVEQPRVLDGDHGLGGEVRN